MHFNNIIIGEMKEEPQAAPQSFCIQQQFQKGPLHLLYSYRMGQLQNKALFFQGQVDPLLDENLSLKDQLVHLYKLVLSSTDILRNLLPNSQHPNKKLQLEMASIQQIATLIKDDWHTMEGTLESNRQQIIQLTQQKINWRNLFENEKAERGEQVGRLLQRLSDNKNAYELGIADLHQQMRQLQQAHELQKRQMHADFADRMKSYQVREREYQLFKRQTKNREEQFQKRINRLQEEIEANTVSFQQAKKNIKQIYEKLMADKLSEQAQNFQLLVKMKEEQKIEVLLLMSEAQEQFKRRAAQKEYEITKLTQRNDRYGEQVGALKNDIWKKQLQLDRQFEQARVREEQIHKLQQDKLELGRQLVKKDQDHLLQKGQLGQLIKSKEKEISMLLAQGKQSLQRLLEQKQSIEKKLQENSYKLQQAELALQKNNKKWQKQINIMKKQWKISAEKLNAQLAEQRKLKERWQEMHQQSQKQKSLSEIQFAQKLKRIEEIHRQQEYVLQSKYGAQISKMKEQHQQTLSKMNMKHQQQISDIIFNSNQEMRQLTSNFNKKIAQQQAQFILEKNQLQRQRMAIEQQAKEMQQRLTEAKATLQEQQLKHKEAIRQFAEQAQLQREKLQQRMIQQRRQFQNEILKQEARLSEIKAQMQKQIRMLKQSTAITSIENKFIDEINKLKEQFAQKIRQNNLACQKEVHQLNQAHQGQVTQLKDVFNKDLNQIVQNIQKKSSILNDRLINEFNDSQLIGLNEQEKKEFIIRKVQQIKKSNEQKESKIMEMEYALDQAEKTVEKRVRARKEELEREKEMLARECVRKIESISSECRAKIEQVEKERIQYSQKMYLQFQSLREQHRNEIDNLTKKYIQLQMIFQQRPSRMQDLTKIKQLMNMQTKLDIEIQGYHKKMETANEIVKYLNLQLQNYKDTYDIFGANGEGLGGGLVGMSVIKASNSGNPHSDTKHILDVIKQHRHASQAKFLSQERKQLKEILPFRRFNDTASPTIKEVKLFQDNQSEHSDLVSREHSEGKDKEKKYSYLMVERGGQRRRRFRTEKNEHEAQIMINAQNFIKLIKGGLQDAPPVIKEVAQQRRKSYRKRKLHKRQPTAGFDQYF